MGRSPRTVTVAQAFREILRENYADRPALADEIQSYDWDYFQGTRWWFETKLTSDEVIAVNKAFELLDEFVVEWGKIRLRGALNHPSKPVEAIDPADVTGSKLDVFAGKLRVFDGNKHIKTYYRVNCYETDLNRCVAKLRSETKRAQWTSPAGFKKFTADYKGRLNGDALPTEAVFTNAANTEGHYRPREEMRQAWRNAFGPRPRGRPTKLQEK